MRKQFASVRAAFQMEELQTLAPPVWNELCGKFASTLFEISKPELARWLGLDVNQARVLEAPLRFAQVALVIPKLSRTAFRLAELGEMLRLVDDVNALPALAKFDAAQGIFKEGLTKALLAHADDTDDVFPNITESLMGLMDTLKVRCRDIRSAYAHIYSVTLARSTAFLSPVYQRKLPSAIPPMGKTVRVASVAGSMQGLYQRLSDRVSDVWAQVKPLISADLDMLNKAVEGLAADLRDTGRALGRL